jgi:hypothetical protein
MPSFFRAPTLFVFLVLAAATANAADFTFFVGGVNPGSISVSGISKSLDSSAVIGGRFSHGLLPFVGMEHTVAFSPDYLFPAQPTVVTETKGFVYSANLIVNIPAGKVVPYVTAGAGFVHQYGSPNVPVGTKFAFNYGGGIKVPKLFGPMGLRFDARGYTAMGVFSTSVNILEVSAGVVFGF